MEAKSENEYTYVGGLPERKSPRWCKSLRSHEVTVFCFVHCQNNVCILKPFVFRTRHTGDDGISSFPEFEIDNQNICYVFPAVSYTL